jgi:PhzF family phenazine biosynthesis protein
MSLTIYHVDAFTDRPFAGNPAAVCILEEPVADDWMQSMAREMGLPETAFAVPYGDGFHLRWFSPALEVNLCGHATLATAHVLWESGRLGHVAQARFQTRSGLLTVNRRGGWMEMDLPALPESPSEPPSDLTAALGVAPLYVGRSGFGYLLEVDSEATVRALQPDFRAVSRWPVGGVIVTARSSLPDFDFVSRVFAPAHGVNEDPVCGSAHCCLAPYWAARLGKSDMLGHQVSSRGGILRVRPSGDRVVVGGQAVTVLVSELKTD